MPVAGGGKVREKGKEGAVHSGHFCCSAGAGGSEGEERMQWQT